MILMTIGNVSEASYGRQDTTTSTGNMFCFDNLDGYYDMYIYIYGYRYMGYSDYWIIWMSNPPCFISAEMPVCVVGKL